MLRQNRWEKEWMILEKKELRYLERQREEKKPSALRQKLEEKIPEGCHIAILTISHQVQKTVDRLVACGITGIVDFTHEHFLAPKGVAVKVVDVVSSIQELVFLTNSMESKAKKQKTE